MFSIVSVEREKGHLAQLWEVLDLYLDQPSSPSGAKCCSFSAVLGKHNAPEKYYFILSLLADTLTL